MNLNQNNETGLPNDSFYLRQIELTKKSVQLQILKNLYNTYIDIIHTKEQFLKSENDLLDKLHFNVWSFQSQICDDVWIFLEKHDFRALTSNYPLIVTNFALECDCKHRNYEVRQTHESNMLLEEIFELETNLENERCILLKKDLNNAEVELQNYLKESPEILRLKNSISDIKNRIHNLKAKMCISEDVLTNKNIRSQHKRTYINPDITLISTWRNIPNNLSSKPLELSTINHNNYTQKRKFESKSKQLDTDNFIRASLYLKNMENQVELKHTPLCEKIIDEAVSNGKSPPNDISKKKFVFKTKSLITQRMTK